MSVSVEAVGVEAVQANLNRMSKALSGPALEGAAKDATLLVTRTAKSHGYVPVDTGRLRASIMPAVVTRDRVVQGIVGSNVEYAAVQETKRQYLSRALTDSARRIYQIFQKMVSREVR